jgi:hypothetical protein
MAADAVRRPTTNIALHIPDGPVAHGRMSFVQCAFARRSLPTLLCVVVEMRRRGAPVAASPRAGNMLITFSSMANAG